MLLIVCVLWYTSNAREHVRYVLQITVGRAFLRFPPSNNSHVHRTDQDYIRHEMSRSWSGDYDLSEVLGIGRQPPVVACLNITASRVIVAAARLGLDDDCSQATTYSIRALGSRRGGHK